MADSIRLEIITPEKLFYDKEIELVIVRTLSGDEGFMARHQWACKLLATGEIWVQEAGSRDFKIGMLSSGFIDVKNSITIFTDVAEWQDEIDVKRAEEKKVLAEQYLATHSRGTNEEEFVKADISLRKAVTRLGVAAGGSRRKR
jgi:F-type H+-transporting ATPase subunit epsilon